MTAADFEPIIQAVMAGIALALTGLISVFVPRAISAFEARTGIQLTAQQQATVLASAMTAKGILETKLDQGLLKISHIDVNNPAVQAEAAAAIARVPVAASALSKSDVSMAETIVGLVDTTTPRSPPTPAPLFDANATDLDRPRLPVMPPGVPA